MADNEEKNYFSFLDIPDGNGGTERWHAKDAEAQAAIQIIEEEIQQLDPASVINVSDITALTDEQCEGLVAGGSVNKSDSTGKHSYKVTYKSATGMCLTYADADNVETVSYDKTNGHWVYNSTDITAISAKADKSATVSNVAYDTSNKKLTKTINGATSDVVSVSTLKTDLELSKSDVGLGSVTNDAQVKRTEMGSANGVASLDSTGKVPSSQLPSYVDDVIEGYYYNSKFYKESTHETEITPESGKIYVDLATDKTYRWSGSAYTQIKGDLALGETETTAYRGDRGKTAYDHSQSTHARTDATKTESSSTNGNIKINGSETTVYTHPSATATAAAAKKVGMDALGHVVLGDSLGKSDVGLGNVGNFKAVSTEASQGLTDTEKGNARTNIGAGTYSKPSGGIPKNDLASAVQTSLGKADTAIQDVSNKADKIDLEALESAIGLENFVDLGLPSGTLWAKFNVGATAETGYGNYYMYGKGATQYNSGDSAYVGTENPLDPSVDTATQVLGRAWSMPTKTQMTELKDYTNYTWETNFNGSGVNGGKFTSKTDASKYIFIPAGGYYSGGSKSSEGSNGRYWSSTPNSGDAAFLNVDSSKASVSNGGIRTQGMAIRPIISKTIFELINEKADNKAMTGATASVAGAAGLVPAPAAGDNVKFLRGDGTWSDDLPRASFVNTTLVFSSGGVFSGSTLLLG